MNTQDALRAQSALEGVQSELVRMNVGKDHNPKNRCKDISLTIDGIKEMTFEQNDVIKFKISNSNRCIHPSV